jgi:hypothetical protein
MISTASFMTASRRYLASADIQGKTFTVLVAAFVRVHCFRIVIRKIPTMLRLSAGFGFFMSPETKTCLVFAPCALGAFFWRMPPRSYASSSSVTHRHLKSGRRSEIDLLHILLDPVRVQGVPPS